MTKNILIKFSALALVLGLMSGCATTEQLKQMQADIERAQQSADSAQQSADAALSAAQDADRKAGAAMDAANAAQASADECSERCERMMHKAMSK
jgi:formate-dependent nitrite reductase cytochrome c552 subunit